MRYWLGAAEDFFRNRWRRRLVIESVSLNYDIEANMFVTRCTAMFGEEQVTFNAFMGFWSCWEVHDTHDYIDGWEYVDGCDSAWMFEGTYRGNWFDVLNTGVGFCAGIEDIGEWTIERGENMMPVETAIQVITECYSRRAKRYDA